MVLGVALRVVSFRSPSTPAPAPPGRAPGEGRAFTFPLFLLLFSSTSLVTTAISAHSFRQPTNHPNAPYFTVTVFSTVGFGDITATTAAARLVVTGQMLIDLVILGVGARVILGAVSRGRQRREPGVVPPGG